MKPTPLPAPAETAQATAAPGKPLGRYEPPAIRWEQPFVALAQTSVCNIPGESECVP
ncbi:hypothetical protein P2318_16895 [Myxococcaceae bacterium GXIMD 01537]